MFRVFSILIFYIFFSVNLNAHVDHYKDLNNIEFDIFRNNEKVGHHKVIFSNKNGIREISTDVFFDIKLLGVKQQDQPSGHFRQQASYQHWCRTSP